MRERSTGLQHIKYNKGKVVKISEKDDFIEITLKKGDILLEVSAKLLKGHELKVPVRGDMSRVITECISCNPDVKLSKRAKLYTRIKGQGQEWRKWINF
jgi:hypothetical protein